MKIKSSRSTGTMRRRVEDIVLGRGKYSAKAIARRAARRKGHCV